MPRRGCGWIIVRGEVPTRGNELFVLHDWFDQSVCGKICEQMEWVLPLDDSIGSVISVKFGRDS